MSIKQYASDKYVGLSTDVKPLNVQDGALFYESDTLNEFILNLGSWAQMSSGGGAANWGSIGGTITNQLDLVPTLEKPIFLWHHTDNFSTFYTANNFATLDHDIIVQLDGYTATNYTIDDLGSMYLNMGHITFKGDSNAYNGNGTILDLNDNVTMDSVPSLTYVQMYIHTTNYCVVLNGGAVNWVLGISGGVSNIDGTNFLKLDNGCQMTISMDYNSSLFGNLINTIEMVNNSSIVLSSIDFTNGIDTAMFFDDGTGTLIFNEWVDQDFTAAEFTNMTGTVTVNPFFTTVFTNLIETPDSPGTLTIGGGNLQTISLGGELDSNNLVLLQKVTSTSRATSLQLAAQVDATSGATVRRSTAASFLSRAWNTSTLTSKINQMNIQMVPVSGNPTSGRLAIFTEQTNGTSVATEQFNVTTAGIVNVLVGNLVFGTASKGVVLKQGANGKCGTFIANGVTPVTVSNTSIAITDCIIISLNTVGGTVGAVPAIQTITAGSGFTVACTALDTSTYNYAIISNA